MVKETIKRIANEHKKGITVLAVAGSIIAIAVVGKTIHTAKLDLEFGRCVSSILRSSGLDGGKDVHFTAIGNNPKVLEAVMDFRRKRGLSDDFDKATIMLFCQKE